MDVRGLATPATVADSRGRKGDGLFRSITEEIATAERTSGGDALSGSAFCADAYYITKYLTLPPSLPTPDEESVAIFSCLSAFVSAPPSDFEDTPIELTKVGGIYRDADEDPSKLGRNNEVNQRDETKDIVNRAEFPQKLPAAKDISRPNSGEGDASKTVTAFHDQTGNSKQLMTEITQFLRLNASSSKLPIAAASRTWTGSSMSTQTDNTTDAASFNQYVLDQQQSSDPSIVASSFQRSDARAAASLVSKVLRPQLFELPECRLPFEAEFCEPIIEDRSLRKHVDLKCISNARKTIYPEPEFLEQMPSDRNAQKPTITGKEIPPYSIVPAEFLQRNLPAPEISFIEAAHSNGRNEKLLSSNETVPDASISLRKGLNTGVHPTTRQKEISDHDVSFTQAFHFSRVQLAQIDIDGKTSLTAIPSIQSQTAPSDKETNRVSAGLKNNEVGTSEKQCSNYTIDLIPPPAEFATDEQTYTNASHTNYQGIVCKGQQSSIQGTTNIDLCSTNDSAAKNIDVAADLSTMTSDASNGFKATNTTRSLMRPKLPPPAPPSRLDNHSIGSFKGGVESSVPTVSRKARENDKVDRISLCQYGRDTALTMLRTETVTIRVKASSTADLVEAIGLSPRFSARPEPPRRSCSIPRKPSTHSLSGDWVRVDPDGSSDDQKQSPEVKVSAYFNGASTMCLRNESLKSRSNSIKALGGESGHSERTKPTAQIRPNAIRAISSSVCIGAKYFPNVESLIQQYSQPGAASASTTEEFKTAGKVTSKYGSKSSSGSTSKFGTLRGRLRDYVTASSTKKQTFSYSVSSRTLSHTKDKNGSKTIKTMQTGTWEPKPTDYQRDEEEAQPDSSSDTKPNYISSYLSFAGPKPYSPPRTISSLVTKTEDQPNLTSTFRTFAGSRIESVSSLASDKDSLAKFRTEATGSQSLTGSPSSSGSPPDSKTEMINEWLESRSVDCNSSLFDSENQSPTKLQSSRTESGPDEPFFRENDPTSVFTREPPSKMSTFRTSGSISVNSSFVPDKVTSPGNSMRPVFPGVITSPGITNRSAIPCLKKDHSKSLPRNVHGRSRNPSESEDRATVLRSPCSFSRSPSGSKVSKESDKGVESRPNGTKEFPAESAFENADCIVTDLIQKLRLTFSEETTRAQDLESSKDRLVGLTRQFVTDSQNLVSSATQNRDQLVQSVTASSETLSRIVDHCLGTASAMGPTSQAVILNNRVLDLTGAYRATMISARVAVGKPLNCPEMKGLMKQATSLAAILSSLIKLLNRL